MFISKSVCAGTSSDEFISKSVLVVNTGYRLTIQETASHTSSQKKYECVGKLVPEDSTKLEKSVA